MKAYQGQHPKACFARIFVRTKNMAMENQYCRVGAVTPMSNEQLTINLLEYRYQNFMDKASDIKYANTRLGEFFEHKARKIKKILDTLV